LSTTKANNKRKTTIRPPKAPTPPPRPDDGVRINSQIRSEKVRLVGADGEMIGVVTIREALSAAEEAGLDLVEISPNAEPPVCKILDYGKFKYEQQKKANEARKKQKVIEVKELKLRPMIEDHDYQVKLRAARKFLEEGDKVKFTLRYRGRELAHQELGLKVLVRMKEDLAELCKVEQEPKMEGRQMIMMLSSSKV
jgi:translation initiation factor IF-3